MAAAENEINVVKGLCIRPKGNWAKNLLSIIFYWMDKVGRFSYALALIIIDTKSITHAQCYKRGALMIFVNKQIRSQFGA